MRADKLEKLSREELITLAREQSEQISELVEARGEIRALLRECQLVKGAFNMAQDGIGIISLNSDRHEEARVVNQSLKEMLGLPEDNSTDPRKLFLDGKGDEIFDIILSGGSYNGEVQMRTNTGDVIDVELHADPVFDENRSIIGVVGVHRDITEKNQRIAQLELYADLIKNAPFGIFLVDEEGNYTMVNEQATKQTGYTEEELLGMNLTQLVPPSELETAVAGFESLKSNGIMETELNFLCKDGSSRPILLSAVQHRETLFAFCADLTDIKALQEEIAKIDRQVAIGKLAGGVAHNFNNALTTLLGSIDVLTLKMRSRQNVDWNGEHEYLRHVEIAGERIAHFVRLLSASAQKSLSQPENILLAEYLSNELTVLRSDLFDLPYVTLVDNTEGHSSVFDKKDLTLIISGLLQNAVDFSDEGEPVSVTFDVNNEETLIITVKDNGQGINEEQLMHLAEPFHKIGVSGGGLTLPAIIGIIEKSGGTIHFDSALDEGTTVTVRLPLDIRKMFK